MTTPQTENFVSTDWLAEHLHDPNLVLLDGSWYLPTENRDPHAEYLQSHLPGARFFDIDGIADKDTDLPHMLPAPLDFAHMVGQLGVSNDSIVVVYDEPGLRSAPRVWWSFKTMGFDNVYILEGGGARWRAEGRPVESGEVNAKPGKVSHGFREGMLTDFDAVAHHVREGTAQILDARPAERFAGAAPEPRPGLRSGHMPGAISVPAGSLVRDGALRPAGELRQLFAERGVDLSAPIVTTCGSGITAATLALALTTAGARDVALYDGSWAEWASRKDTPIEVDKPAEFDEAGAHPS